MLRLGPVFPDQTGGVWRGRRGTSKVSAYITAGQEHERGHCKTVLGSDWSGVVCE